jgi:hypothetical protein
MACDIRDAASARSMHTYVEGGRTVDPQRSPVMGTVSGRRLACGVALVTTAAMNQARAHGGDVLGLQQGDGPLMPSCEHRLSRG